MRQVFAFLLVLFLAIAGINAQAPVSSSTRTCQGGQPNYAFATSSKKLKVYSCFKKSGCPAVTSSDRSCQLACLKSPACGGWEYYQNIEKGKTKNTIKNYCILTDVAGSQNTMYSFLKYGVNGDDQCTIGICRPK